MEQPEGKKVSTNTSASGNDTPAPLASAARPAVSSLAPPACPTCGAAGHQRRGSCHTQLRVRHWQDRAALPAGLARKRIGPGDGAGRHRGTDEHRALNYLAVRYPAIYANAAEAFGRNESLTAVETRLSPLSGTRKIVDVIFAYTNRNTDVTEKYFVR